MGTPIQSPGAGVLSRDDPIGGPAILNASCALRLSGGIELSGQHCEPLGRDKPVTADHQLRNLMPVDLVLIESDGDPTLGSEVGWPVDTHRLSSHQCVSQLGQGLDRDSGDSIAVVVLEVPGEAPAANNEPGMFPEGHLLGLRQRQADCGQLRSRTFIVCRSIVRHSLGDGS